MSDINRFKRDKEVLTTKKINNVIGLYEEGYLQAMNDYKNLIIPVVMQRSEQLKDKKTKPFENWLKENFIKVELDYYRHRYTPYNFKKDILLKMYESIKDSL